MDPIENFTQDFLTRELLKNPVSDWLTALGIALAINVFVGVVKWLLLRRLSVRAAQTPAEWDNAVVAVAQRTYQTLILLVTLFVGSRYLELPPKVETVFAAVATVAGFLQFGLWLSAALDFWLERYRQRSMQANLGAATAVAAIGFVGRILLWAIVLLLVLDNLGVNVTAMVAGLGVGGIAVALAVQNILGDLFASLSIVVDKPFVIGDFIIVDDYMGTVEHVGLKTTRIRSLGGEQIVFSNGDLLKARVRNYKRMYERRVLFTFGVMYDTPPDQLEAIPLLVRELVDAQKLARFERAHLLKFGESSLDYEVVFWMRDPDYNKYMDVQQAVNLGLIRHFAEREIEFAYPTRTLLVEGLDAMRLSARPSTEPDDALEKPSPAT